MSDNTGICCLSEGPRIHVLADSRVLLDFFEFVFILFSVPGLDWTIGYGLFLTQYSMSLLPGSTATHLPARIKCKSGFSQKYFFDVSMIELLGNLMMFESDISSVLLPDLILELRFREEPNSLVKF